MKKIATIVFLTLALSFAVMAEGPGGVPIGGRPAPVPAPQTTVTTSVFQSVIDFVKAVF